jgi:hypothetical protein
LPPHPPLPLSLLNSLFSSRVPEREALASGEREKREERWRIRRMGKERRKNGFVFGDDSIIKGVAGHCLYRLGYDYELGYSGWLAGCVIYLHLPAVVDSNPQRASERGED